MPLGPVWRLLCQLESCLARSLEVRDAGFTSLNYFPFVYVFRTELNKCFDQNTNLKTPAFIFCVKCNIASFQNLFFCISLPRKLAGDRCFHDSHSRRSSVG